eukprot:3480241-Rhodomonas_salina.2
MSKPLLSECLGGPRVLVGLARPRMPHVSLGTRSGPVLGHASVQHATAGRVCSGSVKRKPERIGVSL